MKKKGRKARGGPKRRKKNFKSDKRWLLPYKVATRASIHDTQKRFQMRTLEQAENQYLEQLIEEECKKQKKEKNK